MCNYRHFLIILAATTSLMQGMLVKKLGTLDKQLIIRHARLKGAKSIVRKFEENRTKSQYLCDYDVSSTQKHPPMQFQLLFTRDAKLLRDYSMEWQFAHHFFGYDPLTNHVFNSVDALEQNLGHIPNNGFTTKTNNIASIAMPTNIIDTHTCYWHENTKNDHQYIMCTTTLYYENREETEELLQCKL